MICVLFLQKNNFHVRLPLDTGSECLVSGECLSLDFFNFMSVYLHGKHW